MSTVALEAIKIDKDFKDLIPPLSAEELQQLEENIKKDGCRDPLVIWNGVLIDGHNRYAICNRLGIEFKTVRMSFDSRDEVKIWIIRNQFGRRNLQPFTRTNLALTLEPLIALKAKANQACGQGGVLLEQNSAQAIKTREEVAKAANVSRDTVAKVKLINKANEAGEVPKQVIDKLRSGEVSINRVVRDIKETRTAKGREVQRKDAVAKTDPQFFDNVHIGDFRDNFNKVADGSLSLIFTDPPYDRKASDLFDGLGEFAASKLADGGSLICYIGHIQMQQAMNDLTKHLRFWWIMCCLHSGPQALMSEYGIRVGWKPILWFVKGTRDDKSNIIQDTLSVGGREKSHHDWQQSEDEARYVIDKLCPSDGIVCDPFLGGGTTAAAAIALQRRWVGFEKDHDQAVLAMTRVKGMK